MTKFTAEDYIKAIKNASTLAELKLMVSNEDQESSGDSQPANTTEKKSFGHLEMLVGDEMLSYFHGMKIEDDEDITALVIVNNDDSVPELVGSCILVDKDGSTSYYLPEHPEDCSISRAPLSQCFAKISNNHKAAMEYFLEDITSALPDCEMEI